MSSDSITLVRSFSRVCKVSYKTTKVLQQICTSESDCIPDGLPPNDSIVSHSAQEFEMAAGLNEPDRRPTA